MPLKLAAATVGVKMKTASKFLCQYLQDGDLDRFSHRVNPRESKISGKMMAYIISRETLVEQ